MGKFGRTPGCHGCRDVVIEKAHAKPHSRECRGQMMRLLSESKAGSKRIKAAEDRWVNAAVRRSDIMLAEAEEEKRKIEGEEHQTADVQPDNPAEAAPAEVSA